MEIDRVDRIDKPISRIAVRTTILGTLGTALFFVSGGVGMWKEVINIYSPEYQQNVIAPSEGLAQRVKDIRSRGKYDISGKVVEVETYSLPFQKRILYRDEVTAENVNYQIVNVETDSGTKKFLILNAPLSVGEHISSAYTPVSSLSNDVIAAMYANRNVEDNKFPYATTAQNGPIVSIDGILE